METKVEAQTTPVPPQAPLARTTASGEANIKIYKVNLAMLAVLFLIDAEVGNQGEVSERTIDLVRSIIKEVKAGTE